MMLLGQLDFPMNYVAIGGPLFGALVYLLRLWNSKETSFDTTHMLVYSIEGLLLCGGIHLIWSAIHPESLVICRDLAGAVVKAPKGCTHEMEGLHQGEIVIGGLAAIGIAFKAMFLESTQSRPSTGKQQHLDKKK